MAEKEKGGHFVEEQDLEEKSESLRYWTESYYLIEPCKTYPET